MPAVCMYFQVHQPIRLRRVKTLEHHSAPAYWDDVRNRAILDRAAEKCYLPTNRMLLDLIRQSDGAFRVAFSVSGVFLEQAERFRPDVVESFRELARTGHVEFLQETYYHSLAGLWDDPDEFYAQLDEHRRCMQRVLGVTPTVFRNTELIYDDRIAERVQALGYKAILTEGTERILGERLPNHVYASADGKLPVLLKNYRLSDDVAFRFSAKGWESHPLTAEKYASWLAASPGETINLFMDYETFGEHQWKDTGIFDFLWHLPGEVAKHPNLHFALPSEVVAQCKPVDRIVVPWAISWADAERDVSAWLGNRMQQAAFERLKGMAMLVRRADDPEIEHAWRLLQTSDHLYYVSTKCLSDGDVHAYFSPYESPYLAYINHANAIEDLHAKATALAERAVPVEIVSPPVAEEAPIVAASGGMVAQTLPGSEGSPPPSRPKAVSRPAPERASIKIRQKGPDAPMQAQGRDQGTAGPLPTPPRRALVTGGAGFIGSNLVRRLIDDGWHVHVVDDLLTGRKENVPTGVPVTYVDVASDAFPGNLADGQWDVIIHLAGASSAPLFDEEPLRASQAIRAFQKTLELARECGAKVAFASTSSFYARCPKPYREDMQVEPATLYEFSKLSMEHLAKAYAAHYGVDCVALRFFSVYGPYEQGKGRLANVASQFLWSMRRGVAPIVYGDGNQTRDFTYVDDLIDGLLLALEHADGFQAYNIGTGTEHTFNQLVDKLNEALGTDFSPQYVPNPVRNYVQETLADSGKLQALGWRPKVGLDEGLKRLVARDDPVADELLARIAV